MKNIKTFEAYFRPYIDKRAMSNRPPQFLTHIAEPVEIRIDVEAVSHALDRQFRHGVTQTETGKIEKKIGNRSFDDEFEFFGYVYEYHRKFSLSDNKSDLYLTVGKCDDDWYLVEIYSEWYYSWYLADTEEGLKELASKFQ